MGDGEKLLTHLNSALKVLLGLDIFPRVPKKKLNFVDRCYLSELLRRSLSRKFAFLDMRFASVGLNRSLNFICREQTSYNIRKP